MKLLSDLKDTMDMGRLYETWGAEDGEVVLLTPQAAATIYREFTQLKDEVDILQGMLVGPCGVTTTITKTKENTMDDQRYFEEPYAEQDARQSIIDESVTKMWENLDIYEVMDAVSSGDLDKLTSLLRDQEATDKSIVAELQNIINDFFIEVAEWEME